MQSDHRQCMFCGIDIKPHASVPTLWSPVESGYRSTVCFAGLDAVFLHRPLPGVGYA